MPEDVTAPPSHVDTQDEDGQSLCCTYCSLSHRESDCPDAPADTFATPSARDAIRAVLDLMDYAFSDGRGLTGDNREEYVSRVEPMLRAAIKE